VFFVVQNCDEQTPKAGAGKNVYSTMTRMNRKASLPGISHLEKQPDRELKPKKTDQNRKVEIIKYCVPIIFAGSSMVVDRVK